MLILSLKLVFKVLFLMFWREKWHQFNAAGSVSLNKMMHDPLVEAYNYMSLMKFDLLVSSD
jgi:hypothetical protein